MNDLQIFSNPDFKASVRAIHEPDGKVLFVATDVAAVLGYANKADAIKRHCKGVVKRDTLTDGGTQAVNCIPEGDVIRLAANSKLPGAAKFESWIFDEVIPQVLRTGSYAVQPTALTALEQTVEVLKGMDTRISTLETKQAALEQAVTNGPKDWLATTYDRVQAITGHKVQHSGYFLAPLYEQLEKAENVCLASRQVRQQRAAKKKGANSRELDAITKLYIISLDDRLKAAFDRMMDGQGAK